MLRGTGSDFTTIFIGFSGRFLSAVSLMLRLRFSAGRSMDDRFGFSDVSDAGRLCFSPIATEMRLGFFDSGVEGSAVSTRFRFRRVPTFPATTR